MDDHRTEAACLLETGALYRKRVGLEPAIGDGPLVFAGLKQGAFSLYFDDEPIYHFDLDGRWQRAYLDGLHYLKGLDAAIHEIDRVREGPNLVLRRRKLSFGEAADLDARLRSMALELMAGLAEGRFRRQEPPGDKAMPLGNDELQDFLGRIGRWDTAAWFAHRERYTATYGPLPFLPPECQNAVVLQATLGHAEGRTFGLSSPAEPYVRSPEEFAQHTREVAALWGRRLLQCRLFFLAGDDVLHQPVEQIEAYLDAIDGTFPIRRRGDEGDLRFEGVHSFVDDFTGCYFDPGGWRRLAERGLSRVSLGVESGAPAVRFLYDKTWDDDELRATVAALKSAGIGVSILTLVGGGGVDRAEMHVEQSARLLQSLDFGRGDFVFLLDEDEVRAPGLVPTGCTFLGGAERANQRQLLKEALAPLKGHGVKVISYTLEKQWT